MRSIFTYCFMLTISSALARNLQDDKKEVLNNSEDNEWPSGFTDEDPDAEEEEPEKDKQVIKVDLFDLFDDFQAWLQSDEFQKGYDKIMELYEDLDVEMKVWVQKHWEGQWEEDSGDRWDLDNKKVGWNLDEVREEFEAFFEENDATVLTELDHEDREKFELTMKNTANLYDQGIRTGKAPKPEDYQIDQVDEKIKFQKLYDIAVESANNSK